jgi:hypothetical protein
MGPWSSVWKGEGRDYWVAEEVYRCIYATASYPELLLNGVLILSGKKSACCLREILFHSPFFPFHRPSTTAVLVTATKNLTDGLTHIRS